MAARPRSPSGHFQPNLGGRGMSADAPIADMERTSICDAKGQSRRSSKDRFEAVFIAKFALRGQRPCDLLCKVHKPFRRGTERSVLQGGDAGWPIRNW